MCLYEECITGVLGCDCEKAQPKPYICGPECHGLLTWEHTPEYCWVPGRNNLRSAQPVNGRAETFTAKEEVTHRLLEAWRKHPKLRLGQFLTCVTGGRDIFYDEDFPLIEEIERWEHS